MRDMTASLGKVSRLNFLFAHSAVKACDAFSPRLSSQLFFSTNCFWRKRFSAWRLILADLLNRCAGWRLVKYSWGFGQTLFFEWLSTLNKQQKKINKDTLRLSYYAVSHTSSIKQIWTLTPIAGTHQIVLATAKNDDSHVWNHPYLGKRTKLTPTFWFTNIKRGNNLCFGLKITRNENGGSLSVPYIVWFLTLPVFCIECWLQSNKYFKINSIYKHYFFKQLLIKQVVRCPFFFKSSAAKRHRVLVLQTICFAA